MLVMRLTSAVLIRREGGSWDTPHTTAYTNEAELRDLLAETPSLLPGIDEGPAAAGFPDEFRGLRRRVPAQQSKQVAV
jgi:hypothetical protein